MRLPIKISSSCIWVAIPVDWAILRWYACGADGRSVGRCTGTWLPNFLGWAVYHILLCMVLRCARFARESSANIVPRAQSNTRQCLRDYIFLPHSDVFVLNWENHDSLKSLKITFKRIVKSILRYRKTINSQKNIFEKNDFAKNDLYTPYPTAQLMQITTTSLAYYRLTN